MNRIIKSAVVALALCGAAAAATGTSAAEVVGVHVGGVGLGFTVHNGRYYDSHHRRQVYSYPSDYRRYHHSRSWYYNHPQWNDQTGHDWYRN